MSNYDDITKTGSISEWNEGTLKSLRLHESSELINYYKIDPLKKFGNKWSFELWISAINNLYGEGASKYAQNEKEYINRIKILLNQSLILKPPVRTVIDAGLGARKTRSFVIMENWNQLQVLIELFEDKIRTLNDMHGLSTRNQTTGGLFD